MFTYKRRVKEHWIHVAVLPAAESRVLADFSSSARPRRLFKRPWTVGHLPRPRSLCSSPVIGFSLYQTHSAIPTRAKSPSPPRNFSSLPASMAPTTQMTFAAAAANGVHGEGKPHRGVRQQGGYGVVKCNPLLAEQKTSLRGVVAELLACANPAKPTISLGVGDLSNFACFREAHGFGRYVAEAVSSGDFDGYPPSCGHSFARRAVAEYLSRGVGEEAGGRAGEGDVFLTCGGTQALHVCLTAVAGRGCNVLLPRPGFPPYEAACELNGVEPRYYDLLPERGWEADLARVRLLADDRTAAMVVINPNNPCGAVYSRRHLLQIAETARELSLPIVADEVYAHMVFGGSEFVPMAAFASVAPVLTIGALSKRWLVPGWRLGWIAISDPFGALRQVKVAIERMMNVTLGPTSIVQAVVPYLLSSACDEFHKHVMELLEISSNSVYKKITEIEGFKCHFKPQGAMFTMVEINTSELVGVKDDMDFARKLMKEESVLVLPGSVLGLKNWIRIFFGAPVGILEEACDRIKLFCERQQQYTITSCVGFPMPELLPPTTPPFIV
ncbi:hypothetical protein Taro_009281 [Colocasia esculenta]|uniref:Aminotransferase class I/classII large domain-containing protein n=1 Tax=Colocasia esculenta TaxID=4460 RepID=A0A843TVZ7_COLES|nr:hypothetical protein [Colocasia esculenta]